MKIEYIQKCKYGAVTIRFDNGASNSMFWETFEKLDLDTGDATWLHQSYCCNHCVNHWGIDLCECGSGARKDGLYLIYGNGHAEPFTGDNSKDCVQYIGLKHRYMSFAISLTEHDIVQLLDDDSREESGSGTYYERECDALFDIDGRGNTERLVARNPKLRNLLEDGEYIPSLGQLNLMAHYMDELNKAFAYVSASPLSSTWYWSSTESSQAVAWYVVFSSGLTGTGNKHIGDMVRTVIDF